MVKCTPYICYLSLKDIYDVPLFVYFLNFVYYVYANVVNPHAWIQMINKLICTFTSKEKLDETIKVIFDKYKVMHKKVFVLEIKDSDELAITYNIEDKFTNDLLDDTILVHRKKESNTLYTINALNELIKSLNGGIVDTSYKINWKHYRNSILLTKHFDLQQLKTKIFKIVSF